MESRNHSLRMPLPTPRRPIHRRTTSSSSEASHVSNASHHSHGSEDQFVLSPTHTPANETAPPRVTVFRYATDSSAARNGLLLGKELNARPPQDSGGLRRSTSYLKITPSSQSRPIAIELPSSNRAEPTSTASSIPPEPLSARGDVPGGYFPLHEDPDTRVHAPHPFHLDSDMARQSLQQRAAESSKSTSNARVVSPANTSKLAPSSLNPSTSVSTSPDTPISSYIPSGLHEDVVLPMGKYYPSNWEKRHGKTPQTSRPSTMVQPTASVIRSEAQVPKYHGDQANPHSQPRPASDAKRRLQQYQRDMVAQAAMAANALIASSGSATTSAVTSSLGGVPLPKAQLTANFLRTHKPLSPRLQPVGSPGPVTPMSLEADCYLSLGSAVGGRDAEATGPDIGKGKQRRKDSRASTVELSAASV